MKEIQDVFGKQTGYEIRFPSYQCPEPMESSQAGICLQSFDHHVLSCLVNCLESATHNTDSTEQNLYDRISSSLDKNALLSSEWVRRVQCPTRYRTGDYGYKSFQATNCTDNDNKNNNSKKSNKQQHRNLNNKHIHRHTILTNKRHTQPNYQSSLSSFIAWVSATTITQ